MSTSDNKPTLKQEEEGLVERINDIIDGAERLLKETADQTDEKTSELRAQLSHKIAAMRSSIDEHIEPVCVKGKEVFEATDQYVKKHPWVSVGVVAVGVFALTQLFRRR